MNDLAQTVLGGAPSHGGDFLCRVIRHDHDEGHEDNSESAMRHDPEVSEAFQRAFPEGLGRRRIDHIREAARLLLNFDKCVYQPKGRMASAVATHQSLLGFEGFRRFAIGEYLAQVLDEAGRARIRDLYLSDDDPVSRALSPLFVPAELHDTHPKRPTPRLTAFDSALGSRLTGLLSQPLSKPLLLRFLALGATLGIVLKTAGSGRENGRPSVLALPGSGPLRQQAVQSLNAGFEALYEALARLLPTHAAARELWEAPVGDDTAALEVSGGDLSAASRAIVEALREHGGSRKTDRGVADVYLPDTFAIFLGRQIGCVQPKRDQAGWGRFLVLTPELLEVLVLMFVPPDAPPLLWPNLWRQIRDELGIIIGANAHSDSHELDAVGVLHVSLEELAENSNKHLATAVRRGVARRLPDSGAEAGGRLE